ncbi:glycerate kinase [Pueribacillus theae]|uniref:Glycerate kinase n=1 Tax=Pueribacillus theae TaxID=2171751 RepID=A0A2U1K2R8_9BACI|nr:glycerate kinase [Pueribacillus theae]PWA11817.1 glycerate kinase [Pueribacillus theae]
MKIVVAPDSFKESLSAVDAGRTIERAINKELPSAQVDVFPMADGGEGILDALVYATKGNVIEMNVTGPLGKKIRSEYGLLGDGKTVVIEIAKMAGLMQVPLTKRNPMKTTTYGIGEAISDALESGYHKFIIGLGGSATNDGGLGMLQALGARFLDENDEQVPPFGGSLGKIKKVDFHSLDHRLKDCQITVACDVTNPLCGKEGATYVFGEQKGVAKEQMEDIDSAMSRYAQLIERELDQSYQYRKGAGAAGGLGFALMLLGAKIQSGAELVANTIGIRSSLADADLVITGEGKSDEQTLYGKVPSYISKLAHQHNVKSILLSGSLGEGYEALYNEFISCFSIINKPMDLDEAIANASELLYQQARSIARMLKYFQ